MFGFGKKDEPKAETVIKEDRYLGQVAGNKLDAFNNATYNWRLYMIPDETPSGGGYMNGAVKAKPEETVIIAQTGVTGIAIENISLNIVKGNSGAFVTNGSFTLIQPGAADLLDQIQMAKHALGIKAGMFANAPVFLELSFKGYTDDIDDNEAGGDPVTIDGPWCWQCEIATIDVSITAEGSTYDFTVAIGSQSAFSDTFYTLPSDTSMTGDTIKECLEDLEETLTKFRNDNYKEHAVQDEIVFDLSSIKETLGDGTIKYSNADTAEQVNRLMNAESQGIKTREEYDKALEDNPESLDGGIKASGGIFARDRIQVKQGTNFHRIITTLLVMNDDFLEMTSRKKDFASPNVDPDGLDLNQTFTSWYKIEAHVEWLKYDHRRNTYGKKITYKPVIYATADEGTAISLAEFETTKDNVTNRIKEMQIKKAYHYLYTGLNDQILSADISYKAGQLLLGAPGGGSMGDSSTSPNGPAGDPNDPNAAESKATRAALQTDSKALAKKLAKDDTLRQQAIDSLGLTPAQQKLMADDKSRYMTLAEAIVFKANGGQNPLGYQKDPITGEQTLDPVGEEGGVNNQGNYKPEPSGYLYGADLTADSGGGTETIIGELSGYKAMGELRDAAAGTVKPSFSNTTSIVTTSGNTSDGTPKATLFGYMFQNVNDASILVDLGLKVRGDPWYLGPKPENPTEGKSYELSQSGVKETTMDEISYNGNDNYFLFTMQTPRVIDPDLDDEDNNTGYMSKAGTAYFLSGVYQIMQVTATFNNGMFELDLNAKKQTALDLSNYEITDIDYGLEGE
jgi:hypothetical protein